MSKLSRTKGRAFEQRIAREIREALPLATVRRSQQAHRAYEPDLVIEGGVPLLVRRLWLELTDARAPSPTDKLAQAERDILEAPPEAALGDRLPLVVWHVTGAKSVQVTGRFGDLATVLGLAHDDGVECRGWLDTPVTVGWVHVLGRLRALGARL